MGFLSGWKAKKQEEFKKATAPYYRARNEIWNRESARIGQEEFDKRMLAVATYRAGQTGPSGYEEWEEQIQAEVMRRAHELDHG